MPAECVYLDLVALNPTFEGEDPAGYLRPDRTRAGTECDRYVYAIAYT